MDPSDSSSAIASFSVDDPGLHGKSDVVRINTEEEHYIINLHLRDYDFEVGKTYLVGVSFYGQELGMRSFYVGK